MKHVHWIGTGLSSIPGIRRLAKNLENLTIWNRTIEKSPALSSESRHCGGASSVAASRLRSEMYALNSGRSKRKAHFHAISCPRSSTCTCPVLSAISGSTSPRKICSNGSRAQSTVHVIVTSPIRSPARTAQPSGLAPMATCRVVPPSKPETRNIAPTLISDPRKAWASTNATASTNSESSRSSAGSRSLSASAMPLFACHAEKIKCIRNFRSACLSCPINLRNGARPLALHRAARQPCVPRAARPPSPLPVPGGFRR